MSNPISHPDFDRIVQGIVKGLGKEQLGELRKDFHTRLRITLSQPDSPNLVDDLWDFFYDWCIFEESVPPKNQIETKAALQEWETVKGKAQRGLYTITKISPKELKLKELFSGAAITVDPKDTNEFLGMEKGDIIEGRLLPTDGSTDKKSHFQFARRPSYHPLDVHPYIKKKVKQFKKEKDAITYGNWLWLLVGMYLKHRIYNHMPIEKIYDDNSRI